MAKKTVRTGVWETNSSSCHALAILKPKPNDYYTKEEIMDSIWLRSNGKLIFCDWNMYFGRSPFNLLGDFEGKLRYAVACLVSKYGDKYYNELFDICKKHIDGFEDFEFPTKLDSCRGIFGNDNDPKEDDWDFKYAKTEEQMEQYLKENYPMPNDEEIEFWTYDRGEGEEPDKYWHWRYFYFGGTDDYMLKGWLEEAGITLEEFLTNRRYVVICDGDEYCIWDDMKKTGLINTDMIEREI